jgi:hypothetical protein
MTGRSIAFTCPVAVSSTLPAAKQHPPKHANDPEIFLPKHRKFFEELFLLQQGPPII